MRSAARQSIARKVMWVVLAATFTALVTTGAAMLIYDARTYRHAWVLDLSAQADILARASAPALAFKDQKTARENLALMRVRPNILAAAIYTPEGELFASYKPARAEEDFTFPVRPQGSGYSVSGDRIVLYQAIMENSELLGTVYLRGRYGLIGRVEDYGKILLAVMVGSLLFAAAIAWWMQRSVTGPIKRLTATARQVIGTRDFTLRVKRTTDDEIGVLVDAFNSMLVEVGRRAENLEESNRALEHEMAERRSAEEALRIADRRKDEFLATLAHELRNPLAPIRNGIEILRIAGEDPGKLQLVRAMMQRQLDQMVRLVDDLLDVSRITRGRLAIRSEQVDLCAVLASAVEVTRPLIENKRHRFTVELGTQPLFIIGDSTRLSQVFSNLLNNAARYTPPGGSIALRVRVQGDEIAVSVADSGIGIAADALDSIFDMFVQVDQTLERTNAGLGVGLSLAKRLVELHGGSIEVSSAGLGRGSEFTVRLNRTTPDTAVAAPAPSSPVDVAIARRILLADDNVDFATGLAIILRQHGHEVRLAHDGAAALEIAADFRPEFAFLDIGLPRLNGYDLARRLRALPAASHTVLTAVTGWGQPADRERARQAGFDYHLVKPTDFEQIRRILTRNPSAQAQLRA